MSADSPPLLSLEDLKVQFSGESALAKAVPDGIKDRLGWNDSEVRAVDGVSLDIKENDVVALIGESGSGKTTLGKTAVGLTQPTEGTVRYRGQDVWELKDRKEIDGLRFKDVRRSLQIVHQDPGASLNPYRTIKTILAEPLARWFPDMTTADRHERVLELLKAGGLTPAHEYRDRYPHELSGGEKQRITLVRAMLVQPEVVLADEPVSALDTSLRVEIMDLMLDLQAEFGTSYLFISHNLEHARYIANKADGRIAIMYLGEIVEVGTAEEVIQNPKHPYTKVLKWATLPKHPDSGREAVQEESPLRQMSVPDPANPPSGCRFHPRCPEARAACVDAAPDLESAEEDSDHLAACYRNSPDHAYWDSEPLGENDEETSS